MRLLKMTLATVATLLAASLAAAETLPRFPSSSLWNEDISAAPLDADSTSMIASLTSLGGFGGGRMQIDFSIHVVHADPGAPTRVIVSHPQGYYSPDCDDLGTAIPVPAGAAIEGLSDLSCDNLNEDCHLLIVQENKLYEVYRATEASATTIESQCLAIWNLDIVYPPEGRGEHCTSADAAGFPMAPLLFNADEIATSLSLDSTGDGDLGHAIRFILPNSRMASDASLGGVGGRLYVRPASHAGGPSGPSSSVPYGVRMRLRADFPVIEYPPAIRVILNTFKRFGIVLADGGNIALTAESDLYTSTKWTDLGIDSRIFDQTPGATDVSVADFEVVDTGDRIGETWDCVRSVIDESTTIFEDDFETGSNGEWTSAGP